MKILKSIEAMRTTLMFTACLFLSGINATSGLKKMQKQYCWWNKQISTIWINLQSAFILLINLTIQLKTNGNVWPYLGKFENPEKANAHHNDIALKWRYIFQFQWILDTSVVDSTDWNAKVIFVSEKCLSQFQVCCLTNPICFMIFFLMWFYFVIYCIILIYIIICFYKEQKNLLKV